MRVIVFVLVQVADWNWVVGEVLNLVDENFLVVGQLRNGVFESFDLCWLKFAVGLFRGEFFFDFEQLIVVGGVVVGEVVSEVGVGGVEFWESALWAARVGRGQVSEE